MFYDCWGIAEYKDAIISETIPRIVIDNIKDFFELFDIKSNSNKHNDKKANGKNIIRIIMMS